MVFPTLLLCAAAAVSNNQVPAARVHALLINGGGAPEDNFASHLEHLRAMVRLLQTAGVPRTQVSILASDGRNPAPDVAYLNDADGSPDHAWLLGSGRIGKALTPPLPLKDTQLPGYDVAPATPASVDQWFRRARARLQPGDTLLLYVTDHGTPGRQIDEAEDNEITLWGGKGLSVRRLRVHLARLHPKVRVVTLMSQCFSGGFAYLYDAHLDGGLPDGSVCGFLSTTADRPAYGCFPESHGTTQLGHSFAVFEAWAAQRGSLAAAHRQTLLSDDTPDVPIRTSDAFLEEALSRAAGKTAVPALADTWLAKARASAADQTLLQGLFTRFGLRPVKSLADLETDIRAAEDQLADLDESRKAWDSAFADAADENTGQFLKAHPTWDRALADRALRRMSDDGKARTLEGLLGDLVPFTEARPEARARLWALDDRIARTTDVSYRIERRLAALLRVRVVLQGIAGRALLEGTPSANKERDALARLERCEDFTLPLAAPGGAAAAEHTPATSAQDDARDVERVRPSFLGVVFEPVRTRGATRVTSVQAGTPAAAAGIKKGDLILGPPDRPFEFPRELSVFTKLLPAGQPVTLAIDRQGQRLTVVVKPAAGQPVRRPQ